MAEKFFSHSERVWIDLSRDPLVSDGHLEKGCDLAQVGVCGCRNFHQFIFYP